VTAQLDAVKSELATIQAKIDEFTDQRASLIEAYTNKVAACQQAGQSLVQTYHTRSAEIQKEHQRLSGQLGAMASIAAQFHDIVVKPGGDGQALARALTDKINEFVTSGKSEDWLSQEIGTLLRK
jgi:hypothetical protein